MNELKKLIINGVSYTIRDDSAARANLFYTSLSSAVADLNDGATDNAVTDSNSAVEVFTAENGEKIVRLLADVSESALIEVDVDMTLVLNGHTLNLTTAEAYLNFAEGTNCTINGEVPGSAIKKEGVTGTSSLSTCITVNARGKKFKAVGGLYTLKGSIAKLAMCFRVNDVCEEFLLDGATVDVENTKATASAAKGIQSQGPRTVLRNTTFAVTSQGKSTTVHIVSANGAAEISNCDITSVTTVDASGVQSVAVDMTATYKVENSTITASGYVAGGILSKGHGNIANSTITAAGFKAQGIDNSSCAVVVNSNVFTDAHGAHTDNGSSNAIGIASQSAATLVCIDTNATGTHSGIQNSGDLFVKGGTFSGYSHGGFYFVHGTENKVYINNAVMRFGVYEGSFEDFDSNDTTHRAEALAGFYMGLDSLDSPGISVYMDSCTIEGQGGEPFVVRAGAEGKTNTLYISNTVNNATATKPIRLNKDQTTNRAEMKIGVGCNFTPADTCNPPYAEETGKLYRRIKDDMPMDGRDFNALMTMQ